MGWGNKKIHPRGLKKCAFEHIFVAVGVYITPPGLHPHGPEKRPQVGLCVLGLRPRGPKSAAPPDLMNELVSQGLKEVEQLMRDSAMATAATAK